MPPLLKPPQQGRGFKGPSVKSAGVISTVGRNLVGMAVGLIAHRTRSLVAALAVLRRAQHDRVVRAVEEVHSP